MALSSIALSGKKLASRYWYKEMEGEFSRIEFDILLFLARHPGQVFSYGQIHDGVWGTPINMGRHTLQARVAEVRQKLNDLCPDREYITTVRGRGYRFNAS